MRHSINALLIRSLFILRSPSDYLCQLDEVQSCNKLPPTLQQHKLEQRKPVKHKRKTYNTRVESIEDRLCDQPQLTQNVATIAHSCCGSRTITEAVLSLSMSAEGLLPNLFCIVVSPPIQVSIRSITASLSHFTMSLFSSLLWGSFFCHVLVPFKM